MRENLCICDLIPRLDLATRVIILITKRELKVPTNTGRLAAEALINSAIVVRGIKDESYDLEGQLMAGRPSLLLYPADEAHELTADYLQDVGGPCNLIVPDGSWRQTAKMRQRDSLLASLPIVKIPPGGASAYLVRKETKMEGLATIEAIARALGVMEGPDVQNALEGLLRTMVSRVLFSRGIQYPSSLSSTTR